MGVVGLNRCEYERWIKEHHYTAQMNQYHYCALQSEAFESREALKPA